MAVCVGRIGGFVPLPHEFCCRVYKLDTRFLLYQFIPSSVFPFPLFVIIACACCVVVQQEVTTVGSGGVVQLEEGRSGKRVREGVREEGF